MSAGNCTLCIEWELCPFHKPEPTLTKYTEESVDTVKLESPTKPVCGRVVSDCGRYFRTYANGVCVDEQPID